MTDPVYEMFWDCGHCGQKELLGKTHRHCANCGSPQDPDSRYFPPEDKKVAVHEHQFVGADVTCAYCNEANSAAAQHCTGCGAPLSDGGQAVQQVQEHVVGGQAPAASGGFRPADPNAPPKKRSKVPFILMGIGAAVVAVILVAIFWTQSAAVVVSGHRWQRDVEIQAFQTVNEGAWCDQLPAGAYNTRQERRQRGSNRVQDGENCRNVNVDNGDGTYRQERRCEPRYRSEPTYAQYCHYSINRWAHQRWVTAQGNSTNPAPAWPAFTVTGCQQMGCTRQGTQREVNAIIYQNPADGTSHECGYDLATWQGIAVGTPAEADFRVMGGGIVCSSIGGTDL